MHFDNKVVVRTDISYVASGILHYCGQMAGWMKTPLGMQVDLCGGHIVLDGFLALRERGTAPPPVLGPCLLWPRSPISATAELLLQFTRKERKRKEEYLCSAFLHQGTHKALRHGSHSFTCKQHHACLSFKNDLLLP